MDLRKNNVNFICEIVKIYWYNVISDNIEIIILTKK